MQRFMISRWEPFTDGTRPRNSQTSSIPLGECFLSMRRNSSGWLRRANPRSKGKDEAGYQDCARLVRTFFRGLAISEIPESDHSGTWGQKRMTMQAFAVEYTEKYGFSIIPVKKNKRPFIPWTEFQERKATLEEIQGWWEKWPSANIGIVTGGISGVVVVDVDKREGFQAIQQYIPDSLVMPTCRTPGGGQHMYFQAPEKPLGNNSRLIPGCDFRGEGGYIIAPPSTNGKGKAYEWLNSLSLPEVTPPPLPDELIQKYGTPPETADYGKPRLTGSDFKKILQGQRDEMLFHIANSLIKGKMPIQEVQDLLGLMALHCCDPPFPLKEIPAKIKSALDRTERQQRNISQEVREFVMSSWGEFLSRDVQGCLGLSSRKDQQAIYWGLKQMVSEGIIERVEKRNGCYRRIDREAEEMDFKNTPMETVDISMPFDIEEKVELMAGNIVVVAGEPNVGKTAFLLNVILMNQQKSDIHYFSSEMGTSELAKRLSKFDYSLEAWNFKAYERSENFGDIVIPGQGRINIIDFLEVYDNFYVIGGHLAEIHKKLKGAIALVAIQKNPGVDVGLGGFRGLEKPRLYLAMSPGKLKIIKAKNWAGAENPNRLQIDFRIVDGCKLVSKGKWYHPEDKEANSTTLDNSQQSSTAARQNSTNLGGKKG